MMSLRGKASWAKMTSLGGKLTSLACHMTKYVKKKLSNQPIFLQTLVLMNRKFFETFQRQKKIKIDIVVAMVEQICTARTFHFT
jgi:hypothetical protein